MATLTKKSCLGSLVVLLIGYIVVAQPVSHTKGTPKIEIVTELKGAVPFGFVASNPVQYPKQEEVEKLPSIKAYLMELPLWQKCLGAGVVCLCLLDILQKCRRYDHFRERMTRISEDLKRCNGYYGSQSSYYDENHKLYFVCSPNHEDVAYVKHTLGVGRDRDAQGKDNLEKAYQHAIRCEWDALRNLLEKKWNYGLLYLVLIPNDPLPLFDNRGYCLARIIAEQYKLLLTSGLDGSMSKEQAKGFLALIKQAGTYLPKAFEDLEK